MNFLPETPIEKHHAEAIARGLFAIANSDGMHDREAALIASFWTDTGGKFNALAELERREPISVEELSAVLNTADLRLVFLKTALLMAFADGQVSGEESQLVLKYAAGLGLTEKLPEYETQVKEYLLGHLAHLHNTQGLAEIAKKLAISSAPPANKST